MKRITQKAISGFLLVISTLFLCWSIYNLLSGAWLGFDITDRSYYYLNISQPENIIGIVTLFGHALKPVFSLLNWHIPAFRICGVLYLLFSSGVFALLFSRWLRGKNYNLSRVQSISLLLILFSASLVYYRTWLHIPSYNWLALICTIWSFTGMLYVSKGFGGMKSNFWIGIILTSVHCSIAFLAKPTTAAMLALFVIIFFIFNDRNRKKWLAIISVGTLSIVFLIGLLLTYFGSISLALDNYLIGFELSNAIGGGYSGSEMIKAYLSDLHQTASEHLINKMDITIPIAILGLSIVTPQRFIKQSIAQPIIGLLLFGYLVYLTVSFRFDRMHFATIQIVFLMAALFVSFFSKKKINRSIYFAVGLLLWLSLSVVFGTNNHLLKHLGIAFLFIALAVSLLLQSFFREEHRTLIWSVLATYFSFLTLLAIHDASKKPYRLASAIDNQTEAISFVGLDYNLYVDASTALYIKSLQKVASDHQWKEKTPLLDLTGGTPGAHVILNARIVGLPWLSGAYPGSEHFVLLALQSVDQYILNEAWVLTAPEGRRKLPYSVLKDNQLNFPADYILVGEFKTGHRSELQQLWRPEPKSKAI